MAGAVVVIAVVAFVVARSVSNNDGTPAASAAAPANGNAGAPSVYGAPGAANGWRRGLGTFGTISAIDGSTLTVTDRANQATKVVTNSKTVVRTTAEAEVGDIAPGDRVVVTGPTSGSTIAATRVVDMGDDTSGGPFGGGIGQGGGNTPNGQFRPGNGEGTPPNRGDGFANRGDFALGTVTKVSGTTITIKTDDGSSTTVTTSSSTTITKTRTSSVKALRVGQSVVVRGTTSSDGTVTASMISDGDNRFGDGGPFGGFGRADPGEGGAGA
jgi:hypothetical protein